MADFNMLTTDELLTMYANLKAKRAPKRRMGIGVAGVIQLASIERELQKRGVSPTTKRSIRREDVEYLITDILGE